MVHYSIALLSKLIERLWMKTFENSESRGVCLMIFFGPPRYQGSEADDDSSSVSAWDNLDDWTKWARHQFSYNLYWWKKQLPMYKDIYNML